MRWCRPHNFWWEVVNGLILTEVDAIGSINGKHRNWRVYSNHLFRLLFWSEGFDLSIFYQQISVTVLKTLLGFLTDGSLKQTAHARTWGDWMFSSFCFCSLPADGNERTLWHCSLAMAMGTLGLLPANTDLNLSISTVWSTTYRRTWQMYCATFEANMMW
jgi:hypothetical protein